MASLGLTYVRDFEKTETHGDIKLAPYGEKLKGSYSPRED